MNPTPPNIDELVLNELCELSPAQAIAVDQLTCGFTHSAAATAAGVARETVTRWVSHHPGVRAAMDRARWATSLEIIDRIASIRTCALDLVEQHLETLDPNTPEALTAAVVVLKTLPAAEMPTRRPEAAEALATRDLSSIRVSLYTDPYESALFPTAVSPLRLMLDSVAE